VTDTETDCLFCKIVSKDVPAQVVLDRDDVLAFRDVNPQAPTHILVIPKEHVPSLEAIGDQHGRLLSSLVAAANEVAREDGVAGAFRLVTNVGREAGQSVDHLHLHVLGGRPLGALG
jgi:histidine triad (HIT) family protein